MKRASGFNLARAMVAASLLCALPSVYAQTLPAQAPPPPPAVGVGPIAITMQQAVAEALAKNPTLLSARENLSSIRALEIQAAVHQNPYLQVGGADITLPAQGASNPYSYNVGVGRLFERGQKRRWRVDQARNTSVQTESQLHFQEQQTILSVKQAFTNMVLAKASLKLAQENLADYRHQLDIGRDRYQAGDISKLDFERLDLQLAQFETDMTTAQSSLIQASDQLQTLLGAESPRHDFDVIGEIVPPAVNLTLDDLQQKALAARPDYAAARAAVEVAEANIKLQYANGTADPTLYGEYERSASDNTAGFSLNIPIRIFDRNQGNKASSKFQAQANRFAVTAAHNQVLSDVDQAWSQYAASKVLSDRYNGHYLDEAKDVLDIAKFSYEHGGLALIDYLDALRESRATTADALTSYSQTWMAIHQLSFATATDLVP